MAAFLALAMLAHLLSQGDLMVEPVRQAFDRMVEAYGGPVQTVACLVGVAWLFGYMNGRITRYLPATTVTLSHDDGGTVQMETASIAKMSQAAALRVPAVNRAHCHVNGSEAGVSVDCSVSLELGTDARAATSSVQHHVRDVIDRTTGLTVLNVKVRARYTRRTSRAPVRTA